MRPIRQGSSEARQKFGLKFDLKVWGTSDVRINIVILGSMFYICHIQRPDWVCCLVVLARQDGPSTAGRR